MLDYILTHAWDWFIGSLCFSLVVAAFTVDFAVLAVLADVVFWKRK